MVAQIDSQQQYEQATQAIAKELLAQTREKRSLWDKIGDNLRLDDKLLDWTMGHPGLRVQLFKFIDCLPALQSNSEIANHLQQYMSEEEVELPEALKKLLNFADAHSTPPRLQRER
ncbi:hypothetical protein NON20_21400 [Synechocystis sp. B12]|nr:hypothetical protein NON20_21400 [Synechocystis sp. B12]